MKKVAIVTGASRGIGKEIARTLAKNNIQVIANYNKSEEQAIKLKEELVQEISKKSKVTQKEANEVLSALIETVQKTVSKGKKVTLVGFGTFEPRKRAARNGRNPQTGKEIKIPAKTVPVFSAGKKFKEVVNGK